MTEPGEGIGQVATRKLGGLPVWAWGVIGGGLIIGYSWYRNRQASSTATVSTPDTGSVADPTLGAGPLGDGTLPVSPSYGSAVPSDWLSAAVAAVGDTTDPITALAALQRFLSGETLSAAQVAIVDRAIAALGLPPGFAASGTPVPGATTPAPSTSAPSTPSRVTTLTLTPSQVSGTGTPTLYAYWIDSKGQGITGPVELQTSRNGTWYDTGVITVNKGSGSHKVTLAKGKSQSFRVQSLPTNPKYQVVTSPSVTVTG